MKVVTRLELSDRARELLDDLVYFLEKPVEEVVEEALLQLTHSAAGTSPLSEEEDQREG